MYNSSNTINLFNNEIDNNNASIIEHCNTITNNLNVEDESKELLKNNTANIIETCYSTLKIINNNNINITNGTVINNNDIHKESNNNCDLVIYKVQGDYSGIVCKIIEKSYTLNKRCLLLCRDEEEVNIFDSKLWTYSKLSFIPHGSKYSLSIEDAIHCNTWISEDLVYINNPDYLINLGCEVNENMDYSFTKIIEITCNENDSIDTIKSKYNVEFNKCTLYAQSNNGWIHCK